jgi:hypothetical protein
MTRSSTFTRRRPAAAALAASLCAALAACGQRPAAPSPAPAAGAKAEAKAEPNAEGGETNCMQIDIGSHEFLGDVDLDPAEGTVTLAVLNHASGEPHVHAPGPAVLNLALEGGAKQFEMKPAPREGEPEGRTSTYRVQDPCFKALKSVRALKGRVNLTLDGKTYLCDLAAGH